MSNVELRFGSTPSDTLTKIRSISDSFHLTRQNSRKIYLCSNFQKPHTCLSPQLSNIFIFFIETTTHSSIFYQIQPHMYYSGATLAPSKKLNINLLKKLDIDPHLKSTVKNFATTSSITSVLSVDF